MAYSEKGSISALALKSYVWSDAYDRAGIRLRIVSEPMPLSLQVSASTIGACDQMLVGEMDNASIQSAWVGLSIPFRWPKAQEGI